MQLNNLGRYLKYKLNKEERNIQKEARRFKWLESYGFKTIIDVGANEGQFTKKILRVFPDAVVHSFEPLTDVYNKLSEAFGQNKNIITYNYGLGESAEEKMIYNNEYSPSSSLLEMLDLHKNNFDFAVKSEPIRIQIRTLDSFFPQPPAGPLLLKIDVQGYEMFVLKGAAQILEQTDLLIIETSFYPLYKDQHLFEDIYDYLTARGFRYAGNVEQLIAPTDHKILQADAVFIKR
ncbi:FkbM family methyltransferase [Sediminibacterium ginsengisoli]|uniref:Methyltransferase, FkbM family n=1 Tax=Sediminibacterium ginsengisoli TaxID=413434 RepID=A0A1T4JQF5_9BACT|nr:FkbM family methyltransferase [Sediminibacterium ginsengisoli]SJZ32406.1 methyltransferase, FkbM family [Sediminibacterium ginsengisoli]